MLGACLVGRKLPRFGGEEFGMIGCLGALYIVAHTFLIAPSGKAREVQPNQSFLLSHPRLALE
jgi:hypothetical protein